MNHLRSRSSGCRLAFAAILGMSLTAGATVRNQRRIPRIVNGIVDIGCYEYRPTPGLMLLLK